MVVFLDKKKEKNLEHVDDTLKELEQHGTSELPLEVYEDNCEIYKAVYTHWHKEMEIVYITKGKGIFRLNKEVIHVSEGDIVLISKEMIHYIRTDRKNILHFKSLVFYLSILYGQIGDLCQRGLIEPLIKNEIEIAHIIRNNEPCYEEFLKIYLKIIRTYREKEPYFYVELKSLFFAMFFILLKEHYILPAEGVDHKTVASIKEILDYIESHYKEDLSVSDLANLVHYSDSYLMKVFKQYMGKTLVSYINELRIEKSKYLLIHSDLSITEISMESGYNNSSYYIRKFQELQGITPQKFRKFNRTKDY